VAVDDSWSQMDVCFLLAREQPQVVFLPTAYVGSYQNGASDEENVEAFRCVRSEEVICCERERVAMTAGFAEIDRAHVERVVDLPFNSPMSCTSTSGGR
jgi:hypothetical protein